MKHLFILVTAILFTGVLAISQEDPEIGIVEHLDEEIPLDITLTDENGEEVLLKNLMGKPTVLSFVYYRCPGICSPLMDGIAEVIDKTELRLGEDYQVLTISFDPSEGTELAFSKKRNYLTLMENPNAKEGWMFFTGDSLNISKLTNATGFKYKKTGNDFIHAATLIILSPEGKITRYMNGTYFLPFEMKMSLVDAADGKVGTTINRVLQFCYAYDPEGQQYVLNITKVTGILILFFALIIFFTLLFKKKKKVQNT